MTTRSSRWRLALAALTLGLIAAGVPASPAAADPFDYSVTAAGPTGTVQVGELFTLRATPTVDPFVGSTDYTITYELPDGVELYNSWNYQGMGTATCGFEDRVVTCSSWDTNPWYLELIATEAGVATHTFTITGDGDQTLPDPTPNTATVTTTAVASVRDVWVVPMHDFAGTAGLPISLNVAFRTIGTGPDMVDGTMTWDLPPELVPTDVYYDPYGGSPPPDQTTGPHYSLGECAISAGDVVCTGLSPHSSSYSFVGVTVAPQAAGTFPVTVTYTPGPYQSEPSPDPNPNTVVADVVVAPATTGTIAGSVHGSRNPNPVAGAQVDVFPTGGTTPVGTVTTSVTGEYSVANVPLGSYEVRVTPPSASGYATQWYRADGVASSQATAHPLTIDGSGAIVPAGVVLQDLDRTHIQLGGGSRSTEWEEEVLVAGARSGVALNPGFGFWSVDGLDSASPFPSTYTISVPSGVEIHAAYPRWGAGDNGGSHPGTSCTVSTAQTVSCTLDGIPQDLYLELTAPAAGTFDLTTNHTSATGVEASPDVLPNSSVIPIQVRAPATELHGRAVRSGTGTPMAGSTVLAYAPTDVWVPTDPAAWAVADANGDFAFTGLQEGDYRLLIVPPATSGLDAQWVEGTTNRALANVYVVEEWDPLDAGTVEYVGTTRLQGTVTGPSGSVAGAHLAIYSSTDRFVASRGTTTRPDGTFDVGGLPAGTYKIRVTPPGGSGLATEWYEDAGDRGTATTVTATAAGGTITGIDVLLGP